MRERQPSTVRAGLKLVLDGLRPRGKAPRPTPAPKRRAAVERGRLQLSPARLRSFLAVTRGERLVGEPGSDAPLPPTVSSLWETALALELLSVAGVGLPRGGLIHLESEIVPIRPLHAGDYFRARVELDRTEPHPRGTRLVLRSRCWNGAGQLCQESVVTLLARDASARGSARPHATTTEEGAHASAETGPRWRPVSEWRAGGNLGRRYARVSGDFNPIHLWPWSARLMGFRRPILHGSCIAAMVAHALIAEELGADPRALRRLQISFRAPLLLPASVRLELSDSTHPAYQFRLVDPTTPHGKPYAEGKIAGNFEF